MPQYKLITMDMDGTLTQHKTPLEAPNRLALDKLCRQYHLLMVGAGQCSRIFHQLGEYPIDVIGNYGMQYAQYNAARHTLETVFDRILPCDRPSVERRILALRRQYHYEQYVGDNVEYHASGCVTFPLLGTKADIRDKLAFDPTREKRRAFYREVCAAFPEYTVFVGGSSSFDMAPAPYNKRYALEQYCSRAGYTADEVVFIGDDYGPGGNDEAVYHSPFHFITVDDYRKFPQAVACLIS